MEFRAKFLAMTSEDALAGLRESSRQQVKYDSEAAADRDTELMFETTVAEWRRACDLVHWGKLGRATNKRFDAKFTGGDWSAALLPERVRTLRDVCDLMAAGARIPVIEPTCHLGAQCKAAGAFLVPRDALGRAGADTEGLLPSPEVASWLRKYVGVTLFVAGYLGTWLSSGKPDPVSFGSIHSFRELSFVLAGDRQRS